MMVIFTACCGIFVFAASVLIIAIAIDILDGTDFMDAIVERIREGKEKKHD